MALFNAEILKNISHCDLPQMGSIDGIKKAAQVTLMHIPRLEDLRQSECVGPFCAVA